MNENHELFRLKPKNETSSVTVSRTASTTLIEPDSDQAVLLLGLRRDDQSNLVPQTPETPDVFIQNS